MYDDVPICEVCRARHVFPRNVVHAPARPPVIEVEEADLPCCEPMDAAHMVGEHSVFCRELANAERERERERRAGT